jgi:hypothetical protein
MNKQTRKETRRRKEVTPIHREIKEKMPTWAKKQVGENITEEGREKDKSK